MQLAIEFDPQTATAAVTPHCFVSLPELTAWGLSELTPFCSLAVLCVQSLSYQPKTYFLAWSAGCVSRTAATISLHPRFAESLALSVGTPVSVKIVERLHDSQPPKHPLLSATIHPVTYDLKSKVTAGSSDQYDDVPTTEFELLSLAASTLQRTILPQVRVLYPGLIFPLALPASRTVEVRVVSIETEGNSDPPYAVVQPSSEIIVEAPPSGRRSVKPFLTFARAVRNDHALSGTPEEGSHLTHAFLHTSMRSSVATGKTQLVLSVSQKVIESDLQDEVRAIPIATLFREQVPLGCIALPPFALSLLRLTPLTTVLIERIPSPHRSDSSIQLNRKLPSPQASLPSFRAIRKTKGVYFDGLPLLEGIVHLSDSQQNPSTDVLDSWDNPSWNGGKRNMLVKGSVKNPISIAGFEAAWEFSFSSACVCSMSRRRLSQPFHYDNTVEVDTNEEVQGDVPIPEEDHNSVTSSTRGESEWTKRLLSQLTPSGLEVAHKMLGSINATCSPWGRRNKHDVSPIIVFQGSVGTGKTHICKTVAAVLRGRYNMRTAWIRGVVHANQSPSTLAHRIDYAIHAAADGGPGVVVLDDFDLMCGIKKRKGQSSEESQTHNYRGENETVLIDAKASRLSKGLAECTQPHSTRHRFIVIVTCEKASDLPSLFRSPGFIHELISIPMLDDADRAHILASKIATEVRTSIGESPTFKGVDDLVEDSSAVALLTDGHCAHQLEALWLSSKRLLTRRDLTKSEEEKRSFFEALRESVLSSQATSHGSGDEGKAGVQDEHLRWSMLGGIENVCKKIMDTIKLPSEFPDLFRNAPVQLPRGLLLFGPPGCGKTVIAKTAAAESGLSCVIVKGPELMSKYIGDSEAQVRMAFSRAESKRPCILLFDEFDALAPMRGSGVSGTTGVADRVVNTLLTCLDGVERLAEGVFIMATTSRPEVIDPALLRPGRLDRWVGVDLPHSAEDRLDILTRIATQAFSLSEEVQDALGRIAEISEGYSGADLGAIVNDAEVSIGNSSEQASDVNQGVLIAESLMSAWDESRPSVSKARRAHYSLIMRRFGEQASNDHSKQTPVDSHSPAFGTRLTLQ